MTALVDADLSRSETLFVPGDEICISGSNTWLLLAKSASHQLVEQLRGAALAGRELDAILDILVRDGLSSVCSFAVLRLAASEQRAVVRGSAVIELRAARAQIVRASPGTSWTDVIIPADVTEALLTWQDIGDGLSWHAAASSQYAAGAVRVVFKPVVHGTGTVDGMWGATQRGTTLPTITDAEAGAIAAATGAAAEASAESTLAPTAVPERSDETAQFAPDGSVERPSKPAVRPAEPVGLIDSVPWLIAAPTAQPDQALSTHPPTVQSVAEAPRPEHTVNRSGTSPHPSATPLVLAGRCPARHLTSANAPVCRVCGQPVTQQTGHEIQRPALGILRLSTGDVVTLDRGVVFGRAPEIHAGESPDRPNVMRLRSPHNDLSRNHAEIVLDDWNVYLRDLNSTNGTTVTLPGQPPARLRPNDLFLLESGALINLADEINMRFEVVP